MTRSHKSDSHRGSGGPAKSNASARRSQISRTLSRLLRHQAENEKLPITKDGWVRINDLLAWRGFKDTNKFGTVVTLEDIFDVVEDDGQHGKGRFGVKIADGSDSAGTGEGVSIDLDGAATGAAVDVTTASLIDEDEATNPDHENATASLRVQSPRENSSKNSPETILALQRLTLHPKTPASSYLIRATQGHSIKSVESEGLLTPITLDDPSSIPDTVVHGTFYGAWDLILSSGGLKPMGRNMVHFATGPSISEVLPESLTGGESIADQLEQVNLKSKQDVDAVLSKNKVVSGMRWDAQILIYIDLKRLLHDVHDRGWDMKWFRSDNGVLLTAGVVIPPSLEIDHETKTEPEAEREPYTSTTPAAQTENGEEKQEQEQDQGPVERSTADSTTTTTDTTPNTDQTPSTPEQKQLDRKARKDAKRASKLQPSTSKPKPKPKVNPRKPPQPLVPTEYFSHVIEIKAGLGLIYSHPDGVLTSLPERLKSKGVGFGKGGHMAGRVGGRKEQGRDERGSKGKGRGGGVGGGKPGLNVERDDVSGDLDVDVDDVEKREM